MKKLLTICLFLVTTFTVNAQQLTFEETIGYINNILKENPKVNYFNGNSSHGQYGMRISVDKTGKLIVYNHKDDAVGSFNLFDFEKCKANKTIDTYENGDKFNGENIELLDKNGDRLGKFSDLMATYSPKIEKALKHLRSFCTNADPFGN